MKQQQLFTDTGSTDIELTSIAPVTTSSGKPPQVQVPAGVVSKDSGSNVLFGPQQLSSQTEESHTLTTSDGQSKAKSMAVIATLAGVSFLNTLGSGILISALPRIAKDIGLSEGLLLWPAAVYALAAGCLLLFFGAIADLVGTKMMWMTGSSLYVVFTLAVGLSRTGFQMIMFRACLGVAVAMCLPTAVSLITNTFAKGTWRNIAFASNGMAQPLGFAFGLIVGGIFTDTIGWRWTYYISAIINAGLAAVALWVLPSVYRSSEKKWARRLAEDVDWVGTTILSSALGILLYVLAMTTSSYTNLSDVQNIVLLVVAVIMLGSFPFWMEFQVKRARPAIMPNKIWRSAPFTATCVAVFFCWGSLNAIQYFLALFFQEVQGLSALHSSIRFLPHVVAGVIVNILTGFLISKVKIQTLGVISALITLTSGPLMATIDANDTYWHAAFWAMLLSPVNADVLFTVSSLVISDAFAPEVQSLAGGVFNEIAQIGNSVGLAVTAAIAASVTAHTDLDAKDARMQGYRAAFWTVFAAQVLVVVIVLFGLRKGGLVGKKDD